MTTIQAVLVLLSLIAGIFATLIFRSRLGYRLLILAFFLSATGFVLFPDATNVIAHHLGVTRGADLLLYMLVFAVLHGFLLLYLRTRKLERKITEVIRAQAMRDAESVSCASN
jgi:small membrane protein